VQKSYRAQNSKLSPRFPHGFGLSTKKTTRLLCQASHEDFVSSPLHDKILTGEIVLSTLKVEKSGSNFQVSKREPALLSATPLTNKKRRRRKTECRATPVLNLALFC
jgi:hypothetical protein